ncbi:MAG: M20/M25/M40 family metallo-hydrolase [Clostridia bacterium]|nr:M20/M25/M40 family metallo-hydrolase [Clostridia bacterium]
METKDLIRSVCSLMSINGYEYAESDKLEALVAPYFDEVERDNVGNHIFIKRSKKPGAKKLFIDTHYDEIGLMVKGITDEGFLRVCSVGGVDARLLPCADVVVYGKGKTLSGVALDKPGCIRKEDERGKLTPISDILVDVGLEKSEVEKYVDIGTPVGFKPYYAELGDGYYFGKGLDDKLCSAAVIKAVELADPEKLACDVYFSMSCREEVGQRAVSAATYRIEPDAAIVLDVTFGMAPEGKKGSDMKMGGGPVASLSVILDKKLTDKIVDIAKEKEIPYQMCLEGVGTGTHADDVAFIGRGVPTALLSIPIYFMHTPIETTLVDDVDNTAKLLAACLETEGLI